MMGVIWVVIFVALVGSRSGGGLPLRSTPEAYPHGPNAPSLEVWSNSGLYALPALFLVLTAVGLLFGCTWCFWHKDCKPDAGVDNQLFTASAPVHNARPNPPDSGFSEPANNNISEDNNNGPISLREMQNIANNNAAAYIISENEERNRISRESVVEFEPLPAGIGIVDPLERCADWFGGEDLSRNQLQYLREISRGWFGRVLEGEVEDGGTTSNVAVKILNQNASLDDKARFLDEARMYRDVSHENILGFIAKCLQEDPWILIFELCSMDLRQYLLTNRPKMAILNESGVPLRFMSDVTSALTHLHSRGYCLADTPVTCDNVLVRSTETAGAPRAVLGAYVPARAPHALAPPETRRHPPLHTASSDIWSLGTLIWEICAWGGVAPPQHPPPPDLPCPYRNHLYQVMQLCWNPEAETRPTAAQVHALVSHLLTTHATAHDSTTSDFEERWQRLKPNSIPKIDEHVAIVHAPSTSMASHFTGSDQDDIKSQDTISLGIDTAVSRSSSVMSGKDPLSIQIKSESLTNLHGSLEDVRNIYLTHNETAMLECHQGNILFEEKDNSDNSVDPWLKDIIAGSQDDVSYYKDVSDVIKNLDNILNSEKTSSSESSHQASPSRDNLSLDCNKDYPVQSSMVKSPGISNFQNLLQMCLDDSKDEFCDDEEVDRETVGTLSHSFERHSDTTSQHTLENLTPDTPLKDFEIVSQIEDYEAVNERDQIIVSDKKNTDLPKVKEVDYSNTVPKLKELCLAKSSVSEKHLDISKDCATTCDNLKKYIGTESKVETKSVDNTIHSSEKMQNDEITSAILDEKKLVRDRVLTEVLSKENDENHLDVILPGNPVTEETIDTHNLVEQEKSKFVEMNLENRFPEIKQDINIEDFLPHEHASSVNKDKEMSPDLISDVALESPNFPMTEIYNEEKYANEELYRVLLEEEQESKTEQENPDMKLIIEMAHEIVSQIENQIAEKYKDMPESVQYNTDRLINEEVMQNTECDKYEADESYENTLEAKILSPEIVQNIANEAESPKSEVNKINENRNIVKQENSELRSDNLLEPDLNDSTVYMDLINDSNSKVVKDKTIDGYVEDKLLSRIDYFTSKGTCSANNESTVYLDLPSILKPADEFSRFENFVSGQCVAEPKICASTPKGSDTSGDITLENSVKDDDLSATKVPNCEPGVSLTILEQRYVPDSLSPLESPSKSHHTDTYDENSSVVLGPFENCTMELLKGVKSEAVQLPKEEILAFSSNFSEINLETPSPLRDGNFLNEVPDIVQDEFRYDDATISEVNQHKNDATTDNTYETDQSGTTKHVSPSTPPNSPGFFLASTSQQKYVVDIYLDHPETLPYPPIDLDSGLSSLQKEIDMNQIELTTKLAMAENENNLNIEYSGPLTVEGLVSDDDVILRESEATPEEFLAGNGGSAEDLRNGISLNEECMKALRNELELKLPLAQVASIEPTCEPEEEWRELPPPDLVVTYCGGALSPIAEETRHQLSAYENNCNPCTRTDSSESYLEPCNNSTDEVTDLPTATAGPSTYTVPLRQCDTYTVERDVPSSQEMTMSADSLNGSTYKKPTEGQSPIDKITLNKDDDKLSNCERISQVSPFVMSPSTETSVPVDSDANNGIGVSTLSKTTVPTGAKILQPTDGLSKATSIDSWCSNDTLYNVEENFDDLALDADVPLDFEEERHNKSESTDTLTHHDEDKELSHCSTYIIHDDSESFSPDSITANDNANYTYTKTRTDAFEANTEINDSTKNIQTKDLAYGTFPTYSNCTTEVISTDNAWKLMQPELVRRSPLCDVTMTPPRQSYDTDKLQENSPQISNECGIKKMDSVEITCLQDDIIDSQNKTESLEGRGILVDLDDSPKYNFNKNMAPSVTSTPLSELIYDNDETDPISTIPDIKIESSVLQISNTPNFFSFQQSAELRPQDISRNASNDLASNYSDRFLEAEINTLSIINNDRTPTYSDFENSAVVKPQEVNSKDRSSKSMESGVSSDFGQFESCIRTRPQDLSSLIDASAMLLNSERKSSELALSISNIDFDQSSLDENRIDNTENITLDVRSCNDTNLKESHEIDSRNGVPNIYVTDLDLEDETDQPHSIIITVDMPIKTSVNSSKENVAQNSQLDTEASEVQTETSNRTYDSHGEYSIQGLNHTYTSHSNENCIENSHKELPNDNVKQEQNINDINDPDTDTKQKSTKNSLPEDKSPKLEAIGDQVDNFQAKTNTVVANYVRGLSNGSISKEISNHAETDVKCNGTSENFATVNFINEAFEELIESNVDDESKDVKTGDDIIAEDTEVTKNTVTESPEEIKRVVTPEEKTEDEEINKNLKVNGVVDGKVASVTNDILRNEKKVCEVDAYIPLLSDIRFTGPADEIMSTSFTQESPTEPTPPECEQDSKPDSVAELMKEWDSDTESESSNSSSGEFIWKDGAGHETAVVPSTQFDHQRDGPPPDSGNDAREARDGSAGSGSEGSGSEGSGSEGDEVEFVPSSWDCRAAPAKSSMRSLEQAAPANKKHVVFKRQKYHCVYEYPREVVDVETHSPAAYLPDFSTYCDWDPTSAEEAELGYGQLYGSPLDLYPLRAGIAFGADYDEDFFISSSARPFESLGIMSTTSQFFPGMHVKPALLDREPDDVTDEFPPPPSPLATVPAPLVTALQQTRTASLDFTTPDSGVEDITPGSMSTDEDFKTKKLHESEINPCWKSVDSASSSESVSPSSPGGEALGGLRHTRDKLKLDLPPSPHIPSPRHNRVFNFVLDKPKRHRIPEENPPENGTTPLVMTDETPIVTSTLPLQKDNEDVTVPEPTFSTFGKNIHNTVGITTENPDSEQKIILTDEIEESPDVKEATPVKETVKGEGTVLDSGDEDSGIESSSKASLERNKTPNVS